MSWLQTILVLLAISVSNAVLADTRVALVVGNGAYANASPLSNPPNDAKLVAQSLQAVGFAVTLKQNVGLSELQRTIVQFGRSVNGADIAPVYYAGHGIQLDGNSQLIHRSRTA